MRYLIIHNRYSRVGGEEFVVQNQVEILRSAGHDVVLYERAYDQMKQWRWGRVASFFSAIYNRKSVKQVKQIIKEFKPEYAIVHNLFPVVSPAVLPVLKKANVRILMTVHNFRLVCPIGVFFNKGEICEKCGVSPFREWNCVANKCEGSLLGSIAFAVRSYWARAKGRYVDNVDKFLVLSTFQRDMLVGYGLPLEKMSVVPNFIDKALMVEPTSGVAEEYVGFVGRLSYEKGVALLFEVARLMPHVDFRVAGEFASECSILDIPTNVKILGFINKNELANFYNSARLVISTSVCYDSFPLVLLEAMYYKKPLIVPEVSVLPYVVGDAGVAYPRGDAQKCAERITEILNDENLRIKMGEAGYERVTTLFSKENYLKAIIENSL